MAVPSGIFFQTLELVKDFTRTGDWGYGTPFPLIGKLGNGVPIYTRGRGFLRAYSPACSAADVGAESPAAPAIGVQAPRRSRSASQARPVAWSKRSS